MPSDMHALTCRCDAVLCSACSLAVSGPVNAPCFSLFGRKKRRRRVRRLISHTAQHSMPQHSMPQHSKPQHSMPQANTPQAGLMQASSVQHLRNTAPKQWPDTACLGQLMGTPFATVSAASWATPDLFPLADLLKSALSAATVPTVEQPDSSRAEEDAQAAPKQPLHPTDMPPAAPVGSKLRRVLGLFGKLKAAVGIGTTPTGEPCV